MLGQEIRFCSVGGRAVAYEVVGEGPPLVAPAWWVSHLELDWLEDSFATSGSRSASAARCCATTAPALACPTATLTSRR